MKPVEHGDHTADTPAGATGQPPAVAGAAGAGSPLRRTRDGSIQTLRGLAVLMLVAGHVYGLDAGTGMGVSGKTVGRYLTDTLEYVRLPLFTVISGYVYALRPVAGWPRVPEFVRAKARRLLLPLIPLVLIVGGLQMIGTDATSAQPTATDIALGYVYGYSHLWFLEALFLVMVVTAVLDATHRLDSVRGWAASLAVGGLVFVAVEVPAQLDFFRLSGALLLFPFFLLGYGLARHRGLFTRRPVTLGALAVAVFGFAVQQVLLVNGDEASPLTAPLRALSLLVGLGAITCLFRVRPRLTNRPLAWIGTYAFTIYLLHTIAAAGVRVVYDRVGVDSSVAVFCTGMVAAILLPIAFERTLGRFGPIRLVILGEKPLPRDRVGAAAAERRDA